MKYMLIVLIFSLNANAQKITANYVFNFNNTVTESKLFIYGNETSYYVVYDTALNNEENTFNDLTNEFAIRKKAVANRIITKNLKKNNCFYYLAILPELNKLSLVDGSDVTINWTLDSGIKNILGYTCFRAVGSYKGKSYEAWYAPEISVSDGPWKFRDLPGLILEIKSDDKMLNIYTTQITLNAKFENQDLIIPEYNKKYTWDEYVAYLKQFAKQLGKGVSSSIKNFRVKTKTEIKEPDITISN